MEVKSKENKIIIKALNMYGRVPEIWELLEEIENLKRINEEHKKLNGELRKENDALITVIDLVREKIENTYIFSLRSGKTLIATLINDILEILERVNEE